MHRLVAGLNWLMVRWIVLAVVTCLVVPSFAQGFPSRPIRLVVPFPAGGVVDVTARQLGQRLAEDLQQPVIVDNRPGAGGIIGTEAVARAPADGHTVLVVFDTHVVNPHIYPGLRYDTFKDFAPVSMIGTVPLVFAAPANTSARTLRDFVAQAKRRPGTLSYGSVGAGSSGHLAMEQLKLLTATDVLHVPFRGGAPALTALMGEQIQLLAFAAGAAVPLVQQGKIKGLAVTGEQRTKALPAVPTTIEAGYPQLSTGAWMGLVVPRSTPASVVDRLNAAVAKAARDPSLAAQLSEQAVQLRASSAAEFESFMRSEYARVSALISQARLDLRQ
ncbi:tripartite tricarboxylate transporter substrate binding protein [Variovorax sp. KK3]|uniref:tripartite tricarboxylate transporter substrate binding protein n=1 Tax=Variovorax sp. KK3 TaxID=1855728 RepID=UPI0015C355B2|nr:tripartite tricarboxylate transporter substrate binding protein [Variovorax sp. KK3]